MLPKVEGTRGASSTDVSSLIKERIRLESILSIIVEEMVGQVDIVQVRAIGAELCVRL
jgi:hypothetical protein